ncbi:aspartate-semialdehyde dehydrogenase [Methanopyrus kandleri]|uniref:Aspartate-semialdehyde dehydrogenase n=2 Tax=Methanopyrus kandleri TaxID=2320 RepID=Q8TVK0_METKA|nr:aspartate-semialdehyde dehydrogenase [Methanopyrus kandleri]AAM02602.1 Aspartate-semialdehyde dehydrogenase [Methanopyrus kandleri AV19]HII70282.1 aspartate-semialdehyde dehydrogenase [Methanopyrus kandleri]
MAKVRVGVLGATGIVGQRFISLLADHPWFELEAVTASPRSAGKTYAEAAKWYLEEPMPEDVAELTVLETDPKEVEREADVDLVFSALPSDVARDVEPAFAEAGFAVASNASAYRMEEDVPLVVPEVNPDHLGLIDVQRDERDWDGFIVTNPNCSTIQMVLTLKPLMDEYGIESVVVSTMQAVSGAGYAGVPSMAIIDNVIPYIEGEEEKMETETLKILGELDGDRVEFADVKVSASCHRVPVLDGHTEAIFVATEKEADPEEAAEVLAGFRGVPQEKGLPSAPERPVVVREEEDRPQPRFDRDVDGGMAVVVGRIRKDPVFGGLKYVCVGHNAVRGAAGASVLNAELLVEEGYL